MKVIPLPVVVLTPDVHSAVSELLHFSLNVSTIEVVFLR